MTGCEPKNNREPDSASKRKIPLCKSFKSMLEPPGIEFSEQPQLIKVDFICELRDVFIANLRTAISQATETSNLKLKKYMAMQSKDFVLQPYHRAKNRDIRKGMARFRTGSHRLEIQQGKSIGTDRQKNVQKM